jgi:5-deoxy-glucuronate isomerase
MKFHYRPHELLQRKMPSDLGLEYTFVQRIELDNNFRIETESEEACLVVIKGEVSFSSSSQTGMLYFKDMLYIPINSKISISSRDAILMYYCAPSNKNSSIIHIKFSEIDKSKKSHKIFGEQRNNTKRHVWHFIDGEFPCSRLMMGLCEGEIGGWTVWPPHEHAKEKEEVYVYFSMGKAFAIQCVYDDMDNPYAVEMVKDGDLITIPKGYHPNVCCPGGKISYIYCMVAKEAGKRDFMDLHFQKIYGEEF